MKRASRNSAANNNQTNGNSRNNRNNGTKKARANNVRPTVNTGAIAQGRPFFNLYRKLGIQRPAATMRVASSPNNFFRAPKNNKMNESNDNLELNYAFNIGNLSKYNTYNSRENDYNLTYNFRQNHAPYNSNESVVNINTIMNKLASKPNKKTRKAKGRQ
jgi:hypothetical protein